MALKPVAPGAWGPGLHFCPKLPLQPGALLFSPFLSWRLGVVSSSLGGKASKAVKRSQVLLAVEGNTPRSKKSQRPKGGPWRTFSFTTTHVFLTIYFVIRKPASRPHKEGRVVEGRGQGKCGEEQRKRIPDLSSYGVNSAPKAGKRLARPGGGAPAKPRAGTPGLHHLLPGLPWPRFLISP